MIMADVLTWFLVITGAYLVVNAYWIASAALFPRVVEACRDQYGRRPIVSTLAGLGVLAPFLVLGIGLAKAIHHPAIGAIVKGALMLPVLIALLGSSGLALRIGTGLVSPVDAAQPWRRMLRGGIVLGLLFLLPFVGWFMVMPWALVSGFGAAILTLLSRPRPAVRAVEIPASSAAVPAP